MAAPFATNSLFTRKIFLPLSAEAEHSDGFVEVHISLTVHCSGYAPW